MKPKVLICHGWESCSQEGWFPAAKKLFESKDYEVFVPDFPCGYFPKQDEWVKIIEDYRPNENWILIGHSLGGVAIMRFLECAFAPVGQSIIIASPIESMDFGQIANFFEADFDWLKIKQDGGKINLIYEEGDTLVPLSHGRTLAKKLDASLKIVPGSVHLTQMDVNLLWEAING